MVTVFEKEGAAKKFFVSSGTITINDDSSVQILAEEAHPVEDLDAGAAKQVRCAKSWKYTFSLRSRQNKRARVAILVYIRIRYNAPTRIIYIQTFIQQN